MQCNNRCERDFRREIVTLANVRKMELKEKTMFQQMMASLLRTKRQLEGGRVLRREGSAPARASKLGRLLWPLLRTSVAVAAFVALPALAVGLNDTGITVCGDATTTSSSNCAKVAADGNSFPRQDARYGRDAQNELTMLTKLGGGSTGFDFSRVTNDGTVNNAAPLGPGGTDWACTRDNVTGLTWEVKTTSGLRNKSHTYSFYQGGLGVANKGSCSGGTGCDTTKFVADVNAAGLCGASDWRLPTVKEMENIVDFSRINPPIDPDYFRNTALNQYWTSTADSSYAPGQYFWFVDFFTGAVGRGQPLNARSVRLVRGTAAPTNQFTVTDGGLTVTDASTGLVWKRDYEMRDPANPGTWQDRRDSFLWSEALQRPFTASNANFAGYSDWRLPNAKELRSLISEARHDPAINTTAFPATPFQSYFWSASPATDFNKNQDRTWTVSFDIGSTVTMPRSFTQYVRLVRGGDSFDNLNSTISLSTSLLNFDPQIVMTPSGTRVVTLSNYGKATIGSISISTPASSDYARTTTCTATLAVGQSCSISVTFTPTLEGARADIITISSDATNRPLSLNLAGTGAASEYALSITKAGTGTGTVSPWDVTCVGSSCTTLFPTNTDVTLTATQNTGSTFTGWSGSGCSGTGTCTVRMSQARTVTAAFSDNSIVNHSLTVTKAGTGSGTVGPANLNCGSTICSASYLNGTEETLTATASGSSTFTGWSGSGCSGTGNCIVSMTQARSVTATFTAPIASGYSLTVTKAGTGSGTIGPANLNCGSTICSAYYASGTSVTLTATKAVGSTFSGWSGSGCSGTGNCIVSMTQARSVTATFTASSASYTLTVTKAGTGSGTVSPSAVECGSTICSASYPGGTEVTLTATVAPGSSFGGWSGSGCSGTGTCIVSMTQARSVTATFTVPPVSAALYDGIYQWDAGVYLSLHRIGADTLIGTIYGVNASDTLAVDKLAITNADTFDLLAGPIVGSTSTISGTGFFRACKLSYSLEFNGDSTIKVTRLSVGNNAGVTTTDVDCAARYNAVGTVWTIPRIF